MSQRIWYLVFDKQFQIIILFQQTSNSINHILHVQSGILDTMSGCNELLLRQVSAHLKEYYVNVFPIRYATVLRES